MKKWNKDVVLVLLTALYVPAKPIPEQQECGACFGFAQDHICETFNERDYRAMPACGRVLAYGGPNKAGKEEAFICSFQFEIDGCGDCINSLGIAEDFEEFKKTGLYYWEGSIRYCAGNCSYWEPCDCGPTLMPDFVRPAKPKDLHNFDLFVEGKYK